jgi:hypothetical protein
MGLEVEITTGMGSTVVPIEQVLPLHFIGAIVGGTVVFGT